MASLTLRNVKKIYPHNEKEAKKKSKKKQDEPEKEKVNLQITEQGVVAVQEFNLEIADKEFIVLVGPSGCGKSTTLRMIAGLEEISEGELFIDDRLVNDVAPKDRDIAMVFQSYALYPHMTVYDNMAFALKLKHTPKDEIDRAVKQAAEILDITQYLNRKPKALSGGQRQRVAIGRAIVRDPKVMLMDEPLSNLDAKLRNQMRAEIIKLRQRINTTFIYVTHDQTEAMTLGDRIVIMRDGFIQQIGTPQEVFNHPYNLFVAEFIGSPKMNIFDARLIKANGKYAVQLDNLVVTLSEEKQANLLRNNVGEMDIKLGVRPEHIVLEPGLNGVVDVSELMGSSVHLHVNTQGYKIDQPATLGKMVKASYKATVDGEECERLSNQGANIMIGEECEIPGLSECLVNAVAGEVRTFELELPAEYDEELGGKVAVFEVNVNAVCSAPQDVVMVVSTMNMTGAEVDALNHGSNISYTFPGHVCHVFDPETGINLEA